MDSPGDRLIVALDVPEVEDARRLVAQLEGNVGVFKIGMQLQLAAGADRLIRGLVDAGKKVFLDLKYYDIDATVENAVAKAADLGVSLLTVHWSPSTARAAARGKGDSDLKVLCVTLLTSLDADEVKQIYGYDGPLTDFVARRAASAVEDGCDGVIAAPTEVAAIRAAAPAHCLIVTPGIRPKGADSNDQKRIATPEAAVRDGADYLVVGRPITRAADPAAAARAVVDEMRAGFAARPS